VAPIAVGRSFLPKERRAVAPKASSLSVKKERVFPDLATRKGYDWGGNKHCSLTFHTVN